VSAVNDGVLRTPEEWLKLLAPGWAIADPDGWRQRDAPDFDAPISENEFRWRFVMCTVRTPPPVTEARLWRCRTCGKWSHAKRRPTGHKRTVCLGPASQCVPLCDNCAPFGGCGGADPGEYVEVRCGPFEEWHAEPIQSPHRVGAPWASEAPRRGRNELRGV
jgi:hypothetical protein